MSRETRRSFELRGKRATALKEANLSFRAGRVVAGAVAAAVAGAVAGAGGVIFDTAGTLFAVSRAHERGQPSEKRARK